MNDRPAEATAASSARAVASPHPGMSFAEFVALIAALMALNALSIDVMIPGLPQIGEALGVDDENQRQLVIGAYLIGFGVSQLAYGPLSDRFGRKPVLAVGLVLFALAALGAMLAQDFSHLLLARVIQGLGAGAPRVIAVSLARDCYGGREMGRVMSLAMMVFMAVPILAPSVGQVILLLGPWRWIFFVLLFGGVATLLWARFRLPETLPPERRRPISVSAVTSAYLETITTRVSCGYMVGMGILLGGLFGFINSAQQIFVGVFDLGTTFTLYFAAIALSMSGAAFLNSRLVGRFGMRRLSHGALILYIAVGSVHAALAHAGLAPFPVFFALQGVNMFLFGFIGANFNAMAMDPLGHIAGTASSMIGFFTTTTGAVVGALIGQAFDGTVFPMTLGFACLGLLSLGAVLVGEGGRLFQPMHEKRGGHG